MGFNDINKKIEHNNLYKFSIKHKKVINIIQGFFIILLLLSINMYVVKDYFIKKQISENCGYETEKYVCVCDKKFTDDFKQMQNNNFTLEIDDDSK